jgi:Xaa-Pro aminopeptidase
MSDSPSKLKALRRLMARAEVDAYLIPSTDPHQSEYVPACWQRRVYVSGFTGSAGDLLVWKRGAGLWTDGRYFLQAEKELAGSGIELFKLQVAGVPTIPEWLAKNLRKGQALGVDPRLLSRAVAAELEGALASAGAKLKLLDANLVDEIWEHRPAPGAAPMRVVPVERAGAPVADKLAAVRAALAEKRAHAHVLTTLDAIAWLFNIRGEDVEFNPMVIAHAVVTDKRAVLFVDPAKVTAEVRAAFGRAVEIQPYEAIGRELAVLAKARRRVWVDGATANLWMIRKLGRADLLVEASPITRMKARKNAAEIAGARAAHRRDGVAMVRFFRWLEETVPGGGVSELAIAEKLVELRADGDHYQGESFETIAGYRGHGAIIHYSATAETSSELLPEGVLLVDSGAQYLDGTTDITRTVLLGGEPTAEQRDRYTRVLKGHIALARLRFPSGVAGRRIDAFARLALWEAGLDYGHGTGHGVGAFLSVHEGPQYISPTRCTGVPLEEGNLLSNEPGFYKAGEYGIRIENLVLVQRDEALSPTDGEPFLRFETITLCPIDTRLVDRGMLTADETAWLNAYHARVREELTPLLSSEDGAWLARASAPI